MIFIKERLINRISQVLYKRRYNLGLCDLLNYVFLCDANTVMHKDGAFTSFFEIYSPDFDSSTDDEKVNQAAIWQRAISFLDDGWMLEMNVLSSPLMQTGEIFYGEMVSSLIGQERQHQFGSGQYFTSKTILSLTYKPDAKTSKKLKRFIIENDKKEESLEDAYLAFKKKAKEFIDFLSQLVDGRTLTAEETATYLHQCVSGTSYSLCAPYRGAFLNTYLATSDLQAGMALKVGDYHHRVLTIDGLPEFSYPGILDCLNDFAHHYRWASRFIALSPLTANSYLKRIARNWSSKAIGLMGTLRESLNLPVKIDQAAQAKVDEVEQAQYDNNANIKSYGFYTSTITIADKDKAVCDKAVEHIIKTFKRLGYNIRDENLNVLDAYLGSLPGHGGNNLRKVLVDSTYLSHALPTSSRYLGNPKAPCPYYPDDSNALLLTATGGARPFYFNCHVGDVGHTAILGPTGSGKSTLIAAIIAAHRQYKGSRIIVLDKDRSNECIIKALEGSYFSFDTNGFQLAPFSELTNDNQQAIAQANQWLIETCELMGVEMTPARQSKLHEGIMRLAREPEHLRQLMHLTVQEEALAQVLANLNKGPFAKLLNGTSSQFLNASILGFDLSQIVQMDSVGKDYNIPIIRALFNALERLFQDKRPTLLILEEAWLYLKHPMFANKLTDWFKTLRKANVAVLFVSQDLSDIVHSNAASIIQNSCPTRLFLPNASAQEPFVAKLYESFGLNERQIEIIKEALPKQDYYYSSPLGNRLFRLDLGPLAQSFFCISKSEDITTFHRLQKEHGCEWLGAWLRYKNLHEWADMLDEQKELQHDIA